MRPSVAPAALAVALLAGCLSPSPPDDDGAGGGTMDVALAIDLSHDVVRTGEQLRGLATVTNTGDVAVAHHGYCDPVIALRFLAPDGGEVGLEPPVARCEALSVERLEPGASKRVNFTFDGRVWVGFDAEAPAPAGTYTVEATFRYWAARGAPVEFPDDDTDTVTVVRNATFRWEPAEDGDGNGGIVAGGPEVTVAASRASFREGENVTLAAEVMNQGERSVWYNGICQPPVAFEAERDGERVQFTEPMFYCLALQPKELRPGERVLWNVTWDGRVWEDPEMVEAEPGTYTFVARFQYWTEGDANSERFATEARVDVEYEG